MVMVMVDVDGVCGPVVWVTVSEREMNGGGDATWKPRCSKVEVEVGGGRGLEFMTNPLICINFIAVNSNQDSLLNKK